MVKVITYGTFDLLHHGHIRLLERAKALGDRLIVGVTSDDYDKSRGKINLQQTLMERIEAVRATGLADEIIVEEYEGQKIDDIRKYEVDIFTVGSDWEGKFDYLNKYCKVIYLPRTEGVSSTELRAEQRRIVFGTVGESSLCRKFIREMQYVNGVEYRQGGADDPEIDAVYIASHPERHYADVKQALTAGKHVICESPIALRKDRLEELNTIAREQGLLLEDGIKTAYSTAFQRLLAVANSGRIGGIVSVDAVCTSLEDLADVSPEDLPARQNSICAWGPTAMLPVFQLLGTDYRQKRMATRLMDEKLRFDAFTKIDFLYDSAVASVRVAKGAKAEGELIITGTDGYIYVPAPWWKTDYFEVRFENQSENKRYFYQLDGEGIRYEIVAFVQAIRKKAVNPSVPGEISRAIVDVIESFYSGEYDRIGSEA